MVRRKGSSNSHASTVQERAANNANQSNDLAAKMDKLLGVVQNYEGKADTTMELMLSMQKNFEEELKTLREENGEIRAQMEGRKEDPRKEKTLGGSTRGEGSREKEREEEDRNTKETHPKTKTKENEVSDTASSCTKTKRTETLRGKKSVRLEEDNHKTESKMTRKLAAEDL